ncbi:MAG: sulfatase [Candidatus Wallbacteria bacterium]|nr:sulfatase [Candidatus Wallbacteria bacterium]
MHRITSASRAGRGALAAVAVWLFAGAVLAADRPNVVLFFIDTLRADRVHAYGNPRPTTPNLDALAARGTLFEQAIAQSSWSLPSYSSVFTSLYPPAHNTNETLQMLDPALPRVAGIFRAFGYDTAAFVGGGHLSAIFGMDVGFAKYEDKPHYGSFFHTVPKALSWLESRSEGPSPASTRPFFLMVQGYDVHLPYQAPLGFSELYDPGYRGIVHDLDILRFENAKRISGNVYHYAARTAPGEPPVAEMDVNEDDSVPLDARAAAAPLSARDRAHIVAHYDGALTYADLWLGVFLAALQKRGLLEATLVVVAGDHGEALGEKGVFQHRWDLYDSQLHVPLVVAGPGVSAGRRVRSIVELVDLAPTLLELAGIPRHQGHQGVSLAAFLRPGAAPPELPERTAFSALANAMSARTARWHLVRYADGREELYDLQADPTEQRNVAKEQPRVKEQLESRLLDWYERCRREPAALAAPLSEPDREMFRRSGYW